VDVRRLEQVVVDLIEVGDGPDDVRADVALVGEGLEAAPDADVRVQLEARLGVVLLVSVDPLLDLDLAGAVVDLEGDVCGLRVDAADLADKGDLRDGRPVDLEVCAREGLLGLEDLLYRDGPQRFILVRLGEPRVSEPSPRGRCGRSTHLATAALAALL
jgi:hypothetical protein